MAQKVKAVLRTGEAASAAPVAEGFTRVEIVHETFVPAENGGHQKVLAGAVVDVPELDAAHLIAIGKAVLPGVLPGRGTEEAKA